jgi:Mor family transcriptional regulator
MKEYKVKVYDGKTIWYNLNGQRHREDGPALEYADGTKEWYLNGKHLTEEEFNQRMKPSCSGKVVEIDGKKYKLTEI